MPISWVGKLRHGAVRWLAQGHVASLCEPESKPMWNGSRAYTLHYCSEFMMRSEGEKEISMWRVMLSPTQFNSLLLPPDSEALNFPTTLQGTKGSQAEHP